MSADVLLTGTYTLITCCSCDLSFGVPTTWKQRKREDHTGFNCPNGHALVFNGPSKTEKLEQQLRQAKQLQGWAEVRATAARDQAAAAERSARAYRGVATRVKNRAAHGVCPAPGCKRSFADVARHMAGQHPEFVAEHGGQS